MVIGHDGTSPRCPITPVQGPDATLPMTITMSPPPGNAANANGVHHNHDNETLPYLRTLFACDPKIHDYHRSTKTMQYYLFHLSVKSHNNAKFTRNLV